MLIIQPKCRNCVSVFFFLFRVRFNTILDACDCIVIPSKTLSYLTIFQLLRQEVVTIGDSAGLINMLVTKHKIVNNSHSKTKCFKFSHTLCRKWSKVNRTERDFLTKFEKWLEGSLTFDIDDKVQYHSPLHPRVFLPLQISITGTRGDSRLH